MYTPKPSKSGQKRTISAVLKRKLLEKYKYCCALCGVTNAVAPLEVSHVIPISHGGETTEENLTILCPNCHRNSDRQPREYEFTEFLSGLLERDSNFNNLQREIVLGRETRYRADVLVNRSCGDSSETLLIECKTYLAQFSISSVIGQLEKYKSAYGDCRKILAVPTSLKPEELATLAASDIEVWDLEYIASHFSMQIDEAPPSYYKALFLTQMLRPDGATHEQKLMKSLASCSPGKAECYVYQALVGEILECLFTPTLGKPIQELADESEANRRDFIMPNYSEKGFWLFMREKYEADYVVIDAKNYTQKVKKSEILQIANYLKPHGAGLFGIIVSRKGGDSNGCEHTLREQWLIHRKLILVLDDDDITSMLMAKSDGRQAEDILGQKIEQFRLSM